MSYFENYVEDGLCCEICGQVIDGEEPGYIRTCEYCKNSEFGKVNKIKRNEERSRYAIMQFRKNKIKYDLKNETTGHFHTYRKSDNQLFQFWSGTGKIVGPIPEYIKGDRRGIKTLVEILMNKGGTNENKSN